MTRKIIPSGIIRFACRAGFLSAVAALWLGSTGALRAQTTYIFTGADAVSGTPNGNWSDANNWAAAAVPPVGTSISDNIVFAVPSASIPAGGLNITNDLGGLGAVYPNVLTNINLILFSNMGYNLYGNQICVGLYHNYGWMSNGAAYVTAGSTLFSTITGSNYVALPLAVNSEYEFQQGNVNANLVLAGQITGTGELCCLEGSASAGNYWLLDSDNSFAGTGVGNTHDSISGMTCWAQSKFYFNSMNTVSNQSAIGATGNNTRTYAFGDVSSGGGGTCVTFIGATNCTNGNPWAFWYGGPSGNSQFFSNNSPGNASLTWQTNWTLRDNSSYTYGSWTMVFGGTSTGTNTFQGSFNPINTAGVVATTYPINEIFYPPGTWCFSGVSNGMIMSNLCVISNRGAAVIIQSNEWFAQGQFVMTSGSTLDVTWNDTNALASTIGPWGVGTNNPQTFTAGHSGSTVGPDVIGSLALATPYPAVSPATNGGTLYITGSGNSSYGTLTITNSATDHAVTFVPGGGTLANFIIGTDTNLPNAVTPGTNDLIVVDGNVDLSQGITALNCTAYKGGAVLTGVPYTILTYTGTLIPHAAGSPGIVNVTPPGSAGAGIINTNPGFKGITITFQINSSTPTFDEWTGALSETWNVNQLANENWRIYTNTSTPTLYKSGDTVIFDDTCTTGNTNIVVGVDITPGPIIVSNNNNNYSISGLNPTITITGTTFYKEGTGVAVLSVPTTFTSTPVLSQGTLIAEALANPAVIMGDSNTAGAATTFLVGQSSVNVQGFTVTTNCGNKATIGVANGVTTANIGTISLATNVSVTTSGTTGATTMYLGFFTGTGSITFTGGGSSIDWFGSAEVVGSVSIVNGTTVDNENPPPAGYYVPLTIDATSTLLLGNSTASWASINGAGTVTENDYPNSFVNRTLSVGAGDSNGYFAGKLAVTTQSGSPSSISFTKVGAGTQVFTADNSGAGPGTNQIQGGTVEIDNGASGAGLPFGPTTVNAGATLDGAGTLDVSNSTIEVAGTLLGYTNNETSGSTLTISDIGSTSYVEVQAGGAVAVNIWNGVGLGSDVGGNPNVDQVTFNLPVTLDAGAVLNVTNRSGNNNFSIGDKWEIINWESTSLVTNVFTASNMPPLDPHYLWDLSNVTTSNPGYIQVVTNMNYVAAPTQPAQITGVTHAGGVITITGTNLAGAGSGFHYVVLNTTDLRTPIANWTPIATNGFNSNGSFSFSTGAIGTTTNASFFCTKAVQ